MILNFMLFLFFVVWSFFLRHIAFWLVSNASQLNDINANIKFLNPQLCMMTDEKNLNLHALIFNITSAAWWLYAINYTCNYHPLSSFLFFSALWITVYTDFYHMLISRFVSLYLVPITITLSIFNLLPITPIESISGALFGYSFFWIINRLFYLIKRHDGLGQGDLELMAFIGSYTGIVGCWFTLLIGSTIGTIFICCYMLCTGKIIRILPFGLFLAFGASIFVMHEYEIYTLYF